MGYTHAFGVNVVMQSAINSSDPSPVTIYAPTWDPASPPVVTPVPPVALPAAGGVNLACDWNNTGNQLETRGPSVDDERCVGALFYFPAITAHRCLRSGVAGGVTVCCPGGAGCS